MKLFHQFTFFYGLAFGNAPPERSSYCDATELILPAHAEKWDCNGAASNMVPSGTKCKLKCDNGYVPTQCKLTLLFFHR